MRQILLLILFSLSSGLVLGQFTNDGGTLIIRDSATFQIVDLNIQNINSGSIINQGVLIVKGGMTNELGSTFDTAEDAVTEINMEIVIPLTESPTKNIQKDQIGQDNINPRKETLSSYEKPKP